MQSAAERDVLHKYLSSKCTAAVEDYEEVLLFGRLVYGSSVIDQGDFVLVVPVPINSRLVNLLMIIYY